MFFGSGIFVLRFDISASIILYYHQIYSNACTGAVIKITLTAENHLVWQKPAGFSDPLSSMGQAFIGMEQNRGLTLY